MIKAIETSYKGYRFRSRLEARWAVFFDALGMKWDYEPEGFETSEGYYLPDFFLPKFHTHQGIYAEVKPGDPQLINQSSDCWEHYDGMVLLRDGFKHDFKKSIAFAEGKDIVLLQGIPTLGAVYLYLNRDSEYLGSDGSGRRFNFDEVCFTYKYAVMRAPGSRFAYAHNFDEYRLFCQPGTIEDSDCEDAVEAARTARFEHGETPA